MFLMLCGSSQIMLENIIVRFGSFSSSAKAKGDILIFMFSHFEFWDSHYSGPPGLHKPLNAEEDWLWLRQVPHYFMHRVFHYHNN